MLPPYPRSSPETKSRARRIALSLPLATAFALSPVVAAAEARPRGDEGRADYLFQMEQGRLQLGMDSPEKSFIHYQNALRIDPNGVEALLGLAQIAHARGDKAVAEVAVVRVLSLRPDEAGAHALAKSLGIGAGGSSDAPGGPATRVAAAYLGQAADDGSADGRSSLGVGETLSPALFHAVGFDAAGRLAAVEPQFSCSSGLVLESAGPLRVRAGDSPSADEWVSVRDRSSGAECRVPFRVVGPVSRFIAFEARTAPARAPEVYEVPAGQKLHIQTLGFDAAGNCVYLRRLAWRVERDGRDFTSYLSRPVSFGSPDYGFEPTGNVFAPPADDPNVLGRYAVFAEEEKSGQAAKVGVAVVAPDAAQSQATKNPGKVAWTAQTFEEGLAQAAEQGKLLLVEFQATW